MSDTIEDYYIFEEDFSPDMISILRSLCERYKSRMVSPNVLIGRNRNVFVLPGGIVVKIPTCLDGFSDNDWEGSISNPSLDDPDYDPEDVQFARTRLAYYCDVPIVFMEYVSYAGKDDIEAKLGCPEPDWVMSVDGGQVGFNSSGRLVAFDYGCR